MEEAHKTHIQYEKSHEIDLEQYETEGIFSEKCMKQNEDNYEVDFNTMDMKTARQIQLECEKNPHSDMAKCGLKEQALYAAQRNLIRQITDKKLEQK
jgi:hypothetical protein